MTRLKKLIDKVIVNPSLTILKRLNDNCWNLKNAIITIGAFEYRLVRQIFILKRGVRLPYALQIIVKYIVQR